VTQVTEPQKGSEPVAAKPAEPVADQPLFTLPEDFKPPDRMVTKFTDTVKAKMVDGKLGMSPQEVATLYVDMARDANADWQKQVEQTDAKNSQFCKEHFSTEQLAASETAVGFFSDSDPGFRDFAKRQLNDPRFVNLMRYIGESLAEDNFDPNQRIPLVTVDKRPLHQRLGEKLYGAKQ
jgi:hypothetical protein